MLYGRWPFWTSACIPAHSIYYGTCVYPSSQHAMVIKQPVTPPKNHTTALTNQAIREMPLKSDTAQSCTFQWLHSKAEVLWAVIVTATGCLHAWAIKECRLNVGSVPIWQLSQHSCSSKSANGATYSDSVHQPTSSFGAQANKNNSILFANIAEMVLYTHSEIRVICMYTVYRYF